MAFFKKGGITDFHTNPFLRFFLSVWCACVLCLFTPFLSISFVSYGKNLVLLNLIKSRDMLLLEASNFCKEDTLRNSVKNVFDIKTF